MNYTDLRKGDHLPMVGVLQHLLNRTGASLATDGVFGVKTEAAVRAFQRPRGLVSDGIVGDKTWARLTAGVTLPIVDSVDVTDPTFLKQDAGDIQRAGGYPLLVGGMCNGLEQTVSLLAGYRSVFLLRLHGHGTAGYASVTSGEEMDLTERSSIFSDRRVMSVLGRLRSVFGPYGSVEFIECSTGRGHLGRRLLSELAATLGVPVTAATVDQPFGRLWSFRLFGPTVTEIPGGMSLEAWCRFLPTFAGMTVA
jgi:Putative peptidoglycan binding domain